jgi:hypothetical protein
MNIGQVVVGMLPILICGSRPLYAQIASFNAFGSVHTTALSIDASGAISGYYTDAQGTYHGFIRDAAGNFTSFDPAGSTGTYATSINASGTITGYYSINPNGIGNGQGFIRDVAGNFTSFDVPGSLGTAVESINESGTVTGSYGDVNHVGHGFVRDAAGNFTSFDPSGSTGTSPLSINGSGAITGYYTDATDTFHGFVRNAAGDITAVDPPGSTSSYGLSINASGMVAGYYVGNSIVHGFVRDAAGNFTSFDVPGSTATIPHSINASGTVAGYYTDTKGNHGFIRDAAGNLRLFALYFTYGINPSGAIAGTDGGNGFVGTVPNSVDISRSAGNPASTAWQSMITAGVSYAVVQAWGGGSRSPAAENQLLGAQANDLGTGAYALMNYFTQDSAAYQIGQAVTAVGSAKGNLKIMAVDVEPCCGEFVSWQPLHSYKLNAVIMDGKNHIQKVIAAGISGPVAPSWNDSGGTTPSDGTVTWTDTEKVVQSQTGRIDRISAAVAAIQEDGFNPVIYTTAAYWKQITGNCNTGTTNNCSSLISLPLWDAGHGTFYAEDGLQHCGNGIAGLLPFTPFSSSTWQTLSGNQYDIGLRYPSSPAEATDATWDEYELGVSPAIPQGCNGDSLFGLPAVDLDYLDPALFQ